VGQKRPVRVNNIFSLKAPNAPLTPSLNPRVERRITVTHLQYAAARSGYAMHGC
jgi:hypothetical protein